MGYTHYFSFSKPKGIKAADLEKKYQKAVIECGRVALFWNAYCEHNGDDAARLSGYSAHCSPGKYGGIQINGKGDNSHEPFQLREHFRENERGSVKTAKKPYDCVVVACLAILKYRLGNAIEVSSDGRAVDWEYGVKLASSVLRRNVPNPIEDKAKEVA